MSPKSQDVRVTKMNLLSPSIKAFYSVKACSVDSKSQFMSLRDFINLRYPYMPGFFIHGNMSPQQVVERYDIAKESYEKYGEEGPPADANVRILRTGNFPKSMWWLKVQVIY